MISAVDRLNPIQAASPPPDGPNATAASSNKFPLASYARSTFPEKFGSPHPNKNSDIGFVKVMDIAESGSPPGNNVFEATSVPSAGQPASEISNTDNVPVKLAKVTSPNVSGFGKVVTRFPPVLTSSKSMIVGFGLSWLGSEIVIP